MAGVGIGWAHGRCSNLISFNLAASAEKKQMRLWGVVASLVEEPYSRACLLFWGAPPCLLISLNVIAATTLPTQRLQYPLRKEYT